MNSINLHEMLLAAAAAHSQALAFRYIQGGTVRQIRYGDLARLTFLYAQAYAARGLQPGDRIILCADNSPEWVLACFGAFRFGLTVVPVDARSRSSDLMNIAAKVEPQLLLLGRMQLAVVAEFLDAGKLCLLDDLLSAIPLDIAARPVIELRPVPMDTPALIVFTSGTSGASKGVVLTHANIAANVNAITTRFDVDRTDTLLSVLPLSHMFEFTAGLVGPLLSGATIVYARIRGPEHLKELLKIEKISVLIGVPAVFQNIYKAIESALEQLPPRLRRTVQLARSLRNQVEIEFGLKKLILSSIHKELGGNIKFWAAGGAPVSKELVQGLADVGIPLLAGYGLTEAAPVVATNMRSDNMPGTAGRVLPNVEVKILRSEESADLDSEVVQGEILVRGPNVMAGYYAEPEATEQAVGDGWLHTGDVGYLDNQGYLHVTARIKSTIVTAGGYNIQPEELEVALSKCTAVKDVCVFGLKTGIGEQPHALIIPYTDRNSFDGLMPEIKEQIAAALADLAEYKRLSGFQLFDGSFPTTRLGKVQRQKVAQIYQDLQSRGDSHSAVDDWDQDGKDVCTLLLAVLEPVARGVRTQISISSGSNLAGDLNLDSFARLQLAVSLEEHYGCDIPEDLINDVQTVGELVALVKSQKGKSVVHDAVISDSSDNANNAFENQNMLHTYMDLDAGIFNLTKSLADSCRRWPFDSATDPLLSNESEFVIAARRAAVMGVKGLLKLVGDFEVEGADHLTIDPPYIVVANHSSHVDTAAIFASFPASLIRLVHPVAAADTFFTDRLSGSLATNFLNAVAFDRFGNFEHSLQECEDVLRQGQILIMFPEGTRSVNGQIGVFRNGVSRLAIAVGCPVIPAYIDGASQIMPKKAVLPRMGKLRIRYGLPVYPPPAPANMKQLQAFTMLLRQAVIALAAVQSEESLKS